MTLYRPEAFERLTDTPWVEALAELAQQNLELFRAKPDSIKVLQLPEPRDASLMCGEAGILLVAWRLAPSDALAGRPVRTGSRKRGQRGGRGHVGLAGNADRRARNVRLDPRRALARGLERSATFRRCCRCSTIAAPRSWLGTAPRSSRAASIAWTGWRTGRRGRGTTCPP
jgi:hypothetical protein